jgi:hypothetical protein
MPTIKQISTRNRFAFEPMRDRRDREPSRTNSLLAGSQNEVALGETAAVTPPPAAAVEAIQDERGLSLAIVSPTRLRPVSGGAEPIREPRAFPDASTAPVLPVVIRDEMLEFYAFIFCQGGFRNLGMTFEQFMLVAAALKPADLPATREEARASRI